jgi:hypothetical protein
MILEYLRGKMKMLNKLITSRMQESEITEAIKIWRKQHERYCSNNKSYPD